MVLEEPNISVPKASTSKVRFRAGKATLHDVAARRSVCIAYNIAGRSAYLRARICVPSTDTDTPIIDLPEAPPSALQMYAWWLEEGIIPVWKQSRESLVTMSPRSRSWRECADLIEAHTLGSVFKDEAFQDYVVKLLDEWLDPGQGADWHVLGHVFEDKRAATGLRCFVVEKMFGQEMLGRFEDVFKVTKLKQETQQKTQNPQAFGAGIFKGRDAGECAPTGKPSVNDETRPTLKLSTSKEKEVPNTENLQLSEEHRKIIKRIRTPEPWNFSSRSRIPRIFESIERERSFKSQRRVSFLLPPATENHSSNAEKSSSKSETSHAKACKPKDQSFSASFSKALSAVCCPPLLSTAPRVETAFDNYPKQSSTIKRKPLPLASSAFAPDLPTKHLTWPIEASARSATSEPNNELLHSHNASNRGVELNEFKALRYGESSCGRRFTIPRKPVPIQPVELLGRTVGPGELLMGLRRSETA